MQRDPDVDKQISFSCNLEANDCADETIFNFVKVLQKL